MKEFKIVCSELSNSPEGDNYKYEEEISKLLNDGYIIISSGILVTPDFKYINWVHLIYNYE